MAPVIAQSSELRRWLESRLLHQPRPRAGTHLKSSGDSSSSSLSYTPTSTNQPVSLASLIRRQTPVTVTAAPTPVIPATYAGLNTGLPPPTVVGIVFGTVAGILIILWLIFTCLTMSKFPARSSVVEEEVVIGRSRRHARTASTRSATEIIEVERTHVRSSSRARSRSRSRSRSKSRSPARREREVRRETVITEERRRSRTAAPPVDDLVEVIEEHSPVRPSRKSSGRHTSGYRTVDPDAFAGGDRPVRKVSRR